MWSGSLELLIRTRWTRLEEYHALLFLDWEKTWVVITPKRFWKMKWEMEWKRHAVSYVRGTAHRHLLHSSNKILIRTIQGLWEHEPEDTDLVCTRVGGKIPESVYYCSEIRVLLWNIRSSGVVVPDIGNNDLTKDKLALKKDRDKALSTCHNESLHAGVTLVLLLSPNRNGVVPNTKKISTSWTLLRVLISCSGFSLNVFTGINRDAGVKGTPTGCECEIRQNLNKYLRTLTVWMNAPM